VNYTFYFQTFLDLHNVAFQCTLQLEPCAGRAAAAAADICFTPPPIFLYQRADAADADAAAADY